MTSIPALDTLSDCALLSQFSELVERDRQGAAELLRHIDAIDQRQLWVKLGHPSMFDFCVTRYHMSESTAGKRIGAARTARHFPVVFGMVARGDIHLSGLHRLKAHLTPANHAHVLAEAKHKTIRQIERLVAELCPQADVPSTLRALPRRPAPAPASAPATSAVPLVVPAAPVATAPVPVPTPTAPVPTPRRSPDPVPLSPGRYKLQVTLDEAARQKLKQLQDLLAHQIPNGDPARVIERALDALLTQVLKRKAAIVQKPRVRRTAADASRWIRPIPAGVRREVWTRDAGRCSFIGEDGHRCNETRCLEFAHSHPWGKGGEHSPANVAVRCRAHNAFEADRDYGPSFMASKRKQKPLKVREAVARYRAEPPTAAACHATSSGGIWSLARTSSSGRSLSANRS